MFQNFFVESGCNGRYNIHFYYYSCTHFFWNALFWLPVLPAAAVYKTLLLLSLLFFNRRRCISLPFLSAAKPTDQGEEGVVLLVGFVVVVVGGFGGTVFRSPMYTQKGCIQRKLFLKMGVSRENFSSKGVHSEKTFLQKGCIQRKVFFKMGASRQNFLQKGCIQTKLFFKMGASRQNFGFS